MGDRFMAMPTARACAPAGLSRDASQAEPLVPIATAFSADIDSNRILRVHFRDPVSDSERSYLLAAMNAHCLLPELIVELESARDFLRSAPLESGYCCCGSPVDGHCISDGHSPVDELGYQAGQLEGRLSQAIAKARGDA